jgi:hypothetical protein
MRLDEAGRVLEMDYNAWLLVRKVFSNIRARNIGVLENIFQALEPNEFPDNGRANQFVDRRKFGEDRPATVGEIRLHLKECRLNRQMAIQYRQYLERDIAGR